MCKQGERRLIPTHIFLKMIKKVFFFDHVCKFRKLKKVHQKNGLKLIGKTVGSKNLRFTLPSLNDSSCMCAQGGESFLGRGHTTKLVAELLDSQPEVRLTIYIVSKVF